jgi:hypothetical protein
MTDFDSVERFIQFQEERALDGKTATLEDFREHEEHKRLRSFLAAIRSHSDPAKPVPEGLTLHDILNSIHRTAIEALKEEA